MERATAVRSVRRVTHAVFRRSAKFIQWPSGDRTVNVMRGFEEASRFPRTIGAIDGTHIRIDAPKKNSADYVNRKGFHSVQLQVNSIYFNALTANTESHVVIVYLYLYVHLLAVGL